jgi:hypothetical protein
VSRFHPDYSLDTLLARSQILSIAKLLPKPTLKQKKVRSIRMALKKVSKKNPDKAGARQQYFGDLCKVAAWKYDPSRLPAIRKTVMKTHSQAFMQHPASIRAAYRRRAQAKASQKKNELLKQRDALREDLEKALQARDAELEVRPPLVLSSASWGEAEFQLFQTLHKDASFTGGNLLKLRDSACQAPSLLGSSLLEGLDAQGPCEECARSATPDWVRQIALNRDLFSGCVFINIKDNEEVAYKFAFAIQQPLSVWVTTLTPAIHFLDLSSSSHAPCASRDYHVSFGDNVNIQDVLTEDPKHIVVARGFSATEGGRFTSPGGAQPLPLILLSLPPASARPFQASSSAKKETATPQEPWAEKIMQRRAAKQKHNPSSETDLTEDQHQNETDCEELHSDPSILEELRKYREAMLGSQEVRCNDFQVSLLGGAWTAKHKGVLADAFTGAAKGEEALAHCRSRGIPRSARYEISTYGEENAAAFARSWCSRMQYVFNICCAHEDQEHKLTPKEIENWPEPSEFCRLDRELAGSTRAQQRLAQIKAIV